LDPGASKTIKITFTAATAGKIINQVEVIAQDTAKVQASSTTEVVAPNVSVTKSGPPPYTLIKLGSSLS